MLVKNNVDNGMYVWWVNTTNHTLNGINLGSHWRNISYVAGGDFLASGSDDILVKNNIDNHMYVWSVDPSSHTLQANRPRRSLGRHQVPRLRPFPCRQQRR